MPHPRTVAALLATLVLAGCTGPLPLLPPDPAELPPERLSLSTLTALADAAAADPRTYGMALRCVVHQKVDGRRFAYVVMPERCGGQTNGGRQWEQGVAEIPVAPFRDDAARANLADVKADTTAQGRRTLTWSGKATLCTNWCADNPRHVALIRVERAGGDFYIAVEADQGKVRRDDFDRAVHALVIDG